MLDSFTLTQKILNYKVNKMANASSLNLSELLLFKNNQGGDSIRYENCHSTCIHLSQKLNTLKIF